MTEPNTLKIALGFSGGGYRAAAFNLGVLSFLDQVDTAGGSLLSRVEVISTVSGGTITGSRYAIGIKNGETFSEIYKALCHFMIETDIAALSLARLASKKGWPAGRVKSLINAVADVYDEHLFKGARFGRLMSDEPPIHLKHLSFNATEFANALQFRFQWSELLLSPRPGEPQRGIIGNNYFNIPPQAAADIRMGDILAASSCFPGGFEPINFPADFGIGLPATEVPGDGEYPVGLMDGGIVDNQGIEPILLAEERIKRNGTPAGGGNALSLVIVSDVASPYMEDYQASTQKPLKGWRRWTPAWIFTINTLVLIALSVLLWWNMKQGNLGWTALLSAMVALSLVCYFLFGFIRSLPRKLKVPAAFMKPLGTLLRLRLQVYENLVMNRLNSLLKMSGEVFLKHVRRLNYLRLYKDPAWENRRIMNAIYELRDGEARLRQKLERGDISASLMPTPAIQAAAGRAASMGTTLWFSGDRAARQQMLDALIACGQFTMCWNLLEYLDNLERNPVNINEGHRQLLQCRAKMMEHWQKFREDPYWMVKQAAGSSPPPD